MDIKFNTKFDPLTYRPRRVLWSGYKWKAAAAALLILGAGGAASRAVWLRHPVRSPVSAASAARGKGTIPPPWSRQGLSMVASVPAWSSTGVAPLTETTLVGPVHWKGAHGNAVVVLSNRDQTRAVVGYHNDRPAWVAGADSSPAFLSAGLTLPMAQGRWIQGGNTSINSFSASGPYVYIANGANWAVLDGRPDTHWALSPNQQAVRSAIVSLPNQPALALLLTETRSGQQTLYRRTRLSQPWQSVSLPDSPVTQLVTSGGSFWMLAGGRLLMSTNGQTWRAMYTPPTGFAVSGFAVSPNGNGDVVVSLAPDGEAGVGPILMSTDGGLHWTPLPMAWPNGSAPSALVLLPSGDVAALFPGPPLIIERWSATSDAWRVLPLPKANDQGTGSLSAYTNGDLLYSDAQGHLYRWLTHQQAWLPLPPPPGVHAGQPPSLLMGIGSRQVLAAYSTGWYIFVPAGSIP